jgi:alkylated DNA repair dioxygenase AlkB
MESLFPLSPAFPEGFLYFPEFLTSAREDELLKEISKTELRPFNFQGFEAKRKVAGFGYDYSFDKKSISKGKDIPQSFDSLIGEVSSHLSIEKEEIAELLITEYPAGSVINWHRDAFPFDLIAGISLQSDCIFRLRPHDRKRQGRNSVITFPVRRRSLYVIHGPARRDWQHSISPVAAIRYSITLRTLKNKDSVKI